MPESSELSGDDAAHERIKRSIAESRSVVDVRPYVSWVWFPQATILHLNLSGLIVQTTFAGSSMYWYPLGLCIVLQDRSFLPGLWWIERLSYGRPT